MGFKITPAFPFFTKLSTKTVCSVLISEIHVVRGVMIAEAVSSHFFFKAFASESSSLKNPAGTVTIFITHSFIVSSLQ